MGTIIWIVTVAERFRVTRILEADEGKARRAHVALLSAYPAVSIRSCPAAAEPMRSPEEVARADEMMAALGLRQKGKQP